MKMPELASDIGWGETLILPSSRELRSTTHTIGARYPCRSIALIPRLILRQFASEKGVRVLDPFMGSGTTAKEASEFGFEIFGLEVDPFARLISEVSVHVYLESEIEDIQSSYEEIRENFLSGKSSELPLPNTSNIEYWFDPKNLSELMTLRSQIESLGSPVARRFFLVVLSDIVRAASKAERQSLKPYISKKYAKKRHSVLDEFDKAYSRYFSAIENSPSARGKTGLINWLEGDATNFKSRKKVNVAITSPPYINAMDYVRCVKLESSIVGLGNDDLFSEVRQSQIGEQVRSKLNDPNQIVKDIAHGRLEDIREVDAARYRTAMSYFQDMHDNLVAVYNALKPEGAYYVIVGDSTIRNVPVETHRIIAEIGKAIGFEWQHYFNYPIRDHRTSLPRNGNGGKIAEEYVIGLVKH